MRIIIIESPVQNILIFPQSLVGIDEIGVRDFNEVKKNPHLYIDHLMISSINKNNPMHFKQVSIQYI